MIDGRLVSATTTVRAPAARVFSLLADPSRHASVDGSGTGSVRGLLRGPDRLFLGARFAMSMHLGVPYAIVNRVVEFEEGRRLAWTHASRAVWRYELEPLEGTTTRVSETFDLTRCWLAALYERTGVLQAGEAGIVRSLALLKDVVEHEHQRSS